MNSSTTTQDQDAESRKRRERIELLQRKIQQRKEEGAMYRAEVRKKEVVSSDSSSKDEGEIRPKIMKTNKQTLTFERGIGEIEVLSQVHLRSVEKYDQEVQAGDAEPIEEIASNICKNCERNIQEVEENFERNDKRRRMVNPCDDLKKNEEMPEEKALEEFSKEEVRNLVHGKEFCEFFDRSSKLIEKALDSGTVNLFGDLLDEHDYQYECQDETKEFYEIHSFHDKQLTSSRVVTSIDWSPNVSELFLASYSQSFEGNVNDLQGVLLVWSSSLRSRPEFTCYSQSQITAAKFNQFSNSMIIGGTYSGQVMIWDLRTTSSPVQKSGIVGGPLYSLDIVGTQNSHNIISISNDGKLCVWDTKMLTNPQKEIDLKVRSQATQDIIGATCLCFPHGDANNFFTGTENGTIYSGQVHCRPEENIIESFTGHQGPITSLSMMNSFRDLSSNASNLLLSSSYDWTVKLWNPRLQFQPIWSFEAAEDCIYDVAWSPTNPTLFSSVDRDGYIDLWDLSKDLEVPCVHYKGDSRALNKLAWSRDGSKMLTGSADGNLKLYGLEKNLQKASEESLDKFETQMFNLSNNSSRNI